MRDAVAGDGEPRFLFLAAFAGTAGSCAAGAAETGAAALAAAALAGSHRRTTRASVLLAEEDPVLAERLRERLETAGIAATVRAAEEVQSLAPGEAAVVAASFAELAPILAPLAAPPARALLLLDPPAAGELPLDALQPLLASDAAELLIVFPATPLDRLAAFRGVPVADLPPYARRLVEGYSRFFGERGLEWLQLWRAAEREAGAEGAAAALARLVEHYRARLAAVAPGTVVRWAPIAPPRAPDDPFFLFLATADPARALLLNQILHEARLAGEVAWGESLSGLVRYEEDPVLDLFGAPATHGQAALPRVRHVDLPALAHEIATRFAGETVPVERVLLEVAESDLLLAEVKRALGLLRRDGRAAYGSLAPHAEIVFPPLFSRARG